MDPEIAVFGCGIAGLESGLRLERKGFEVTIFEPRDSTMFYPALHHIFHGREVDDVTIDLEGKFKDRDIELVNEEVTGMRPEENVVETTSGEWEYRKAVVAVGSETSYGTIQGEGNVNDLRFRDDAVKIRDHLSGGGIEDVVIVGGGATGVEAAGSMPDDIDVTVLEAEDRLLPAFPGKIGRTVERSFRSRGIGFRTGAMVDSIEEDHVVLEGGEKLGSEMTVWAGGVKPNPVLEEFGLPVTEDGVEVDSDLRAEGEDDVYVAGDAADYEGKVNRAFYAIAEAKTVAENIARSRNGKDLEKHRIARDPNLIYMGRWDSLFEMGGLTWRGRIPALMRRFGLEERYLWTRRHLL
ncbi:MAG: NAD(P)/FAD-dependent oxidoreductase [Candidatus Nanohaloarchaea archaeon]